MIRQSIIIYQYFIRRNRQHTMHTGSNTLKCFYLGVSVKTVEYRISQALKILRIKLKDYLPLLSFLSL